MRIRLIVSFLAAIALQATSGRAQTWGTAGGSLTSFKSHKELSEYLRKILPKPESRFGAKLSQSLGAANAVADKDESLTNNQHQGVDEGGIVKLRGDHLVILRRGRLFTVGVGDRELRPISAVDAFGPDIDPAAAWFDEMLIYRDKVIVVGFSYQRGGTEIGVFRINRAGGLRHLSTYHLRSNDYYSARNYASRLIGSRLVFYTPLYLPRYVTDPMSALPALREWRKGAGEGAFRPIVTPRRVYRPARELDPSGGVAFHTVTSCDLASERLECEATVVIGPPSRVFYVSGSAVYVWVSEWYKRDNLRTASATLYRVPLNSDEPTALGVSGSPVDQFSFLESADGHLNVLVRSDSRGDAMWQSERTTGSAALLRVPLQTFGDGSRSAPRFRYRTLPAPDGYIFQNRFVGDHLLYGAGNGWGRPRTSSSVLHAVPWRGGEITRLTLSHGVDRIEVMGRDAVVVGIAGQDLQFSGIRLDEAPAVAQTFTLENASQGELRSHGFFYRSDGRDSGVLGLPVRGAGRPGYEHLFHNSASILFLRNDGRDFRELGELEAQAEGATNDGCKASCVDWYGNARPLFLRGRVFALLGYELVEGSLRSGGIDEVRRVNFAPRAAHVMRQ